MASLRERGVTFEDHDFGEMYAALVTEESTNAMAVRPALLVVAASNGPGG